MHIPSEMQSKIIHLTRFVISYYNGLQKWRFIKQPRSEYENVSKVSSKYYELHRTLRDNY